MPLPRVLADGKLKSLCESGPAYHSLAIKNDGTTWTWGYNSNGQLGNGTTTNSSTPIQVSGPRGITSLAGGGWHSLANAQIQPSPTLTTTYGYDTLYRLTSVDHNATSYTGRTSHTPPYPRQPGRRSSAMTRIQVD